jgi:mRNA interferase MazF
VDYGNPIGSAPGFRRPAIVLQANSFNASNIRTVLVVPLTSNLRLGDAPGNVLLSKKRSGLTKDSVANVSHVGPLDRLRFLEVHGVLPADTMLQLEDGLRTIMDL